MSDDKPKNLKLFDMPVHVCEEMPEIPGIMIFPPDTIVCPYCGGKLKEDSDENETKTVDKL